MSFNGPRCDARFWAFTIVGTLTASICGCFAFAIAAQTTRGEDASIVSVDDAIHRMELRRDARADHLLVIRSAGQHVTHEGALVADAVR